jgi:hypothetical protein
LRAHSHLSNRLLHFTGSLFGMAVAIAAFALHHPWYVLLWPLIGYSFAWFGHFVVEGNEPATFGHPSGLSSATTAWYGSWLQDNWGSGWSKRKGTSSPHAQFRPGLVERVFAEL